MTTPATTTSAIDELLDAIAAGDGLRATDLYADVCRMRPTTATRSHLATTAESFATCSSAEGAGTPRCSQG